MTSTRLRPIVTSAATRDEADRSIARHDPTNGLDAEHYGETIARCVGCERRNAAAAVASIRRESADRHAILYRSGNRFAALDLDGPFVEIVDDLVEIGLDSDRAEDEAWRLVNP